VTILETEQITSLILSSLYFRHANFAPLILKSDASKSLHQNVRKLRLPADVVNLELLLFNTLTNEVESSSDVLTMIMEHEVLAPRDCRFVVDQHHRRTRFLVQ
jgi:hypothetical protein